MTSAVAQLLSELRAKGSTPSERGTVKTAYRCADCGGPRSYGSARRCLTCYERASVEREIKRQERAERHARYLRRKMRQSV